MDILTLTHSCLSPNMKVDRRSKDKFLGLRAYIQVTAITLMFALSGNGKAFRHLMHYKRQMLSFHFCFLYLPMSDQNRERRCTSRNKLEAPLR